MIQKFKPGGFDFVGDEKQAKFHGAFDYVTRLDSILRHLNETNMPDCHINGQNSEVSVLGFSATRLYSRLNLLKVLYSELKSEMKDGKPEKLLKMFDDCKNEVQNIWLRASTSSKVTVNTSIFRKMDDLEWDLRQVISEEGLLMPRKADGMDAAGL